MLLTVLEEMPENLLTLEAPRLHEELAGPTLIHLKGKEKAPLFVSVLLHGNEHSGWQAVQQLFRKLKGKLPRSISLFIGNVEAARQNKRHLEGQADYNRIWRGGDGPEQKMATQIIEILGRRNVFASIDLHNNTGKNPYYACINVPEGDHLNLAHLFGNVIVYFTQPDTVLSIAMSKICPSVTVECGQSGEAAGVKEAASYIERCLNLSEIPKLPIDDISLFHTVATITIPENIDFNFNGSPAALSFSPSLADFNFKEISAGTIFAQSQNKKILPFKVQSEDKKEVGNEYFAIREGVIVTKKAIMPSMLTTNTEIVRQDCLCYLMQRMKLS